MFVKDPDDPGWEGGGEPMERRLNWVEGKRRLEDKVLGVLLDLTKDVATLKSSIEELQESFSKADVHIRLDRLEKAVLAQAATCSKVQEQKAKSDEKAAKEKQDNRSRPLNAIWVIIASVTSAVLTTVITKLLMDIGS